MAEQTWTQDLEFNLAPIVVNGVTINGSYRLQSGRFLVSISTSGRTAELTFSCSSNIVGQPAADALARSLVDAAHAAALSLPPV